MFNARNTYPIATAFLCLVGFLLSPGTAHAPAVKEGSARAGNFIDPRTLPRIPGDTTNPRSRLALPGPNLPWGDINEPTVAVDPNDSLRVAVAGLFTLRTSVDGGRTFGSPQRLGIEVPLPATHGWCGDPSIGYDSQGRLFWTFLGCTYVGSERTGIDIFIARLDPVTGALLPGYPVNVTAQIGAGAGIGVQGFHNDKEWLAVDSWPDSPFRDRLYIAWSDITGTHPPDPVDARTTFSTDHGLTWSAPLTVSAAGEPTTAFTVHNAVAPNGDVYVAYHSESYDSDGASIFPGGVYLVRSTNGGVSFSQKTIPYPPGTADITTNIQRLPGAIPGVHFQFTGSEQPFILPDPLTPGRVYVVASDDPDNDPSIGDPADVMMATTSDYGLTWSRTRIDDGPGATLQIMPTGTVDANTGCLVVTWYDNRAGLTPNGYYLLDVFARASSDGGATWDPAIRLNDVRFDPQAGAPVGDPGPPPTYRIGEYNGIAAANGIGFAAWCGSTFDASGNPVGQQVIFDRFAFDIDPPVFTSCPASIQVECTSHCVGAANYPEIAAFLAGATATDDCDETVIVSHDAPTCFTAGTTMVTFTARDDAGNRASCSANVNVTDTVAPSLTLELDRDVLWPPNHKMTTIIVDVTALDACDPEPDFRLVSISSDEPDDGSGDGDTANDIQGAEFGTADTEFQLRSERSARGNGRTYTIVYTVTDDAGNSVTAEAFVRVPIDQTGTVLASTGFRQDGTGLLGRDSYTLVIPSRSGDREGDTSPIGPGTLDEKKVFVGNHLGLIAPLSFEWADVNEDHAVDLVLQFPARSTLDLAQLSGADGDPVGIRYEDLAGDGFQVGDIFSLGPPIGSGGARTQDGRIDQPLDDAARPDVDAQPMEELAVSPNPFRELTTLSFQLAAPERTIVSVYDIRGRRLVTLMDEVLPAGRHEVRWNGRSAEGRSYPDGIYFFQVIRSGVRETRKVILRN